MKTFNLNSGSTGSDDRKENSQGSNNHESDESKDGFAAGGKNSSSKDDNGATVFDFSLADEEKVPDFKILTGLEDGRSIGKAGDDDGPLIFQFTGSDEPDPSPLLFDMSPPENRPLVFCTEAKDEEPTQGEPWKVLVVDDEEDVHAVTKWLLRDFSFEKRKIQLFNAFSANEAKEILKREPDLSVAILDVVMETEDAGLKLVEHIRQVLKNRFIRIILRTGQPGYAPEQEVILKYDINDYRNKSELTSAKFLASMITSLRAYRDIVALDHTRRDLSDSEALKSAVITSSLDAIIALDDDDHILEFNPAAEQMFGYSRQEVRDKKFCQLLKPRLEGACESFESILHGLNTGEGLVLGKRIEIEACRANDQVFPVELTISELFLSGRRAFAASIRDITELKQIAQRMEQLAYFDDLTKLPNRYGLELRLERLIKFERSFSVVHLYLDQFQNIKNSLGSEFADNLLLELVNRLHGLLEEDELFARLEREQLALVLQCDPDEMDAFRRRLNHLEEELNQPFRVLDQNLFLTASMGLILPEHTAGYSAEVILRNVEIAVSQAREMGGATRRVFTDSMHRLLVSQQRTESDLRQAINSRQQLWVAYQPIICLRTGELAGFEALVRWHHPSGRQIPPGEFIPLAETTGLVIALGEYVLQEACKTLASWHKKLGGANLPFISINVSQKQIAGGKILPVVARTLNATGIDPRMVKLEITESGIMENANDAIRTLEKLKELGVKLVIDDFGTGYSSLAYLQRLPVDTLKIDRSFVTAMHASQEDFEIVRTILRMAGIYEYDVVAEGIETEKDHKTIRDLACQFGQGYYFGRPLNEKDSWELLKKRPCWD